MLAVRAGTSRVAKILLDNGAKMMIRNHKNETPLFLAIGRGELKTVEEMTRKEYDKSWFEKDSDARTPLHYALLSAIQGPQNYLLEEYKKQKQAYCDLNNGSMWIIGQMQQNLSSAKVRRERALAVLHHVFSHCLNLFFLYPDEVMDNMWVNFIGIALENFDFKVLLDTKENPKE
jgi:ankyrin repeat protein